MTVGVQIPSSTEIVDVLERQTTPLSQEFGRFSLKTYHQRDREVDNSILVRGLSMKSNKAHR